MPFQASFSRFLKRLRSERGSAVVELGLILPILVLVVVALIDVTEAVNTRIAITNGAREGARWITLYPDDAAGARSRVLNETSGAGLDAVDLAISFTPNKAEYDAGDLVTVTVRYSYSSIVGVPLNGLPGIDLDLSSIPITAESSMRVLY